MTKEIKILVAEDEPNMRKLLYDILSIEYEVITATDGLDAKEKLKKTPVDIIIADLKMPKMSGKELIEYVHTEVDPEIINIVITAYKELWSPADASDQHVFHYFVKGEFEPKDLKKVVHNAIEYREARKNVINYGNQLKKRTDELTYLQEHLDSITVSAPTGIITINKELRIAKINPVIERMFGVKETQYLGEPLIKVLDKAFTTADDIVKKSKKTIENSTQKIVDSIPMDKLDKKFVVRLSISPLLDIHKHTIGGILIVEDITEKENLIKELEKSATEKVAAAETARKRADELEKAYAELQNSKDELVRSEKLAFTGRISASIAHEIRNPLTNISMSVQQLKKLTQSKDRGAKHIDIIIRNTERVNYLITELLNSAKPPKLDMQPYDIHSVLKNVLETTNPKIRLQKIKVVKKFTPEPSIINIDKTQIERAFLNIVINAIESMPRGGELSIVTEVDEKLFAVKIQDTGKGIPEEDIIRIFDPFFSSKPKGVGLGLNICYGIIVSHNGIIEVESKYKKGSIFTISLPIGQKVKRK